MIKAPNVYSPARNPAKAQQRRDLVLRLMREEKQDRRRASSRAALAEPVVDAVVESGADDRAALRGLRQGRARGALRREAQDRGPADLHDARRRPPAGGAARGHGGPRRRSRRTTGGSAAAAKEGAAPGRAHRARAARRAPCASSSAAATTASRSSTASRRRTGSPARSSSRSSILAAFARRDLPMPITPATILVDSPITVAWDERADGPAAGPRATTTGSSAARCRRAGPSSSRSTSRRCGRPWPRGCPRSSATARAAGIGSRLRPYPSVALGAFEISPMEIAAAYAVFANGGVRVRAERDRRRA